MTSIGSIASQVASSAAVAGIDLISSANGKAIGAIFEDRSSTPAQIFKRVMHDEALEPAWETFFCSIITKIAKIITPNIPEQITMIPGKLIGAAWHWGITSHQSTNRQALQTANGEAPVNATANSSSSVSANNEGNFLSQFYDSIVKGPSEFLLTLCGLGKKNESLLWFGASQLGLASLLSLGLANSDENLPGVNLDSDESLGKSLLKGAGYTVVEQATYAASQAIRYYTDFKDDFNPTNGSSDESAFSKFLKIFKDKDTWAKAWANVVNERFFPGHILSGIAASFSTWALGKHIPRVTAAAIGEFPTMLLNRILNCHRRRATKEVSNDNGEVIPNYRFNNSGFFKSLLNGSDRLLDGMRDKCIKAISYISNISEEELKKTFSLSRERLQAQHDQVVGSATT